MNEAALRDLIQQHYAAPGAVVSCEAMPGGRIHHSYRVRFERGPDWLLQRFNTDVFSDPRAVMNNIERVCAHIGAGRDEQMHAGPSVPGLVPCANGATMARTPGGEHWRAFIFIAGTRAFNHIPDSTHAYAAAQAFARFAHALSDLPPPALSETIPGFHDTPARLVALRAAVDRDPLGRLSGCAPLAQALLAEEPLAHALEGGLPRRTIHNDTKINNLLFAARATPPIVSHVVDLDTVMPGVLAHDFGDLVRSAANTAPDEDRARFDIGLFAALARGYTRGIAPLLSSDEWASLRIAPQVLSLELAARFLTDHILGDGYFQVVAAGDNLRRARAQTDLLGQMRTAGRDMDRIMAECRMQRS
ncbi:MAG: phosphotransferase enzyme family protein [Gammaproteobacteria bacterium]